MDDDFLKEAWKDPPPEFAASLYERISQVPSARPVQSPRWRARLRSTPLTGAALFLGLLVALGAGFFVATRQGFLRPAAVRQGPPPALTPPAPTTPAGAIMGNGTAVLIVTLEASTPLPEASSERSVDSRTEYDRDRAIRAAEEAIAAALAEVEMSPELNPRDPVARLLTLTEVGKWQGTCVSWTGYRPTWLVGIRTDGMPKSFGGSGRPVTSGFEGVFVVVDANEGAVVAAGTLDSRHTLASIQALSSMSLEISYETPMPAVSGDARMIPVDWDDYSATLEAAMEAAPTDEAICQQVWWGSAPPTATPSPTKPVTPADEYRSASPTTSSVGAGWIERPPVRVLWTEDDAIEFALERAFLKQTDVRDIVARLMTHRRFNEDLMHGGSAYGLDGIPGPDEPIWVVSYLYNLPKEGYPGYRNPSAYGAWIAYYANTGSGAAGGGIGASLEKHERLRSMESQDLEIVPGTIRVRVDDP